jgi:hypothetical protein
MHLSAMPNTSALSRIEQLKAELARLQSDAVQELREKRERLVEELADVDTQLAELTGSAPVASRRKSNGGSRKVVSFEELKGLLQQAPGHSLNIRRAGYDLATIKGLIAAHPAELKFVPAGPWPSVALA